MKKTSALAALILLPACQMTLPEALQPGKAAPAESFAAETATQATEAEAGDAAEAELAEAFVAAAQAAQAEEAAESAPPKKGLFAFLSPKADPSPLKDTGIEVVEGTSSEHAMTALAPEAAAREVEVATAETAPEAGIEADTAEVHQAGLGGLFGFLKPKAKEKAREEVQLAALPVEADEADAAADSFVVRPETHGVSPEVAAKPEPDAAPQTRKPLFGFLKAGPGKSGSGKSGPVSTVARGEVLPFGEVGILCDAKKRDMGTEVDQFPHQGRAAWQLYDTAPDSAEPRTQFITGFADGCARQVTAALIMFGEAGLHEVLRYSEGNDASWSEADERYEKIKRKACGVGRKTRCPAEKLGGLESQLAFVSVYPRFGAEHGWLELLLHDGAVMSEEIR
ncbi:hypothetical protein [Celeribacter neptunius]|uniref:Uncharacterized protein n=1 Tax=Celeribacter neptunius TaxID=588602 RepID=A0A1I3QEH4_9RHOB|nr:hypothetical protein [Celeribacter neptunius]SFJ31939.1 hypothetical protein SAMN04487991_1795 [Celeribacter neptunius]